MTIPPRVLPDTSPEEWRHLFAVYFAQALTTCAVMMRGTIPDASSAMVDDLFERAIRRSSLLLTAGSPPGLSLFTYPNMTESDTATDEEYPRQYPAALSTSSRTGTAIKYIAGKVLKYAIIAGFIGAAVFALAPATLLGPLAQLPQFEHFFD